MKLGRIAASFAALCAVVWGMPSDAFTADKRSTTHLVLSMVQNAQESTDMALGALQDDQRGLKLTRRDISTLRGDLARLRRDLLLVRHDVARRSK